MEGKEEAERQASGRKTLKDIIREKREAKLTGLPDLTDMQLLDDPYKASYSFQNKIRKPTAYAYVPSEEHFCPWDSDHPENPQRCISIHDRLVQTRTLKRVYQMKAKDILDLGDISLLTLAHTRDHIENVKGFCERGEEQEASQYDSIYYNGQGSYHTAVNAARTAVSVAAIVASGEYQNGFANIRPPGHHTTHHVPNGYCLFNNVAIAAKYLLRNELAKKILIIDYDVHHGQGTQEIFYDSKNVLYFSIHRYEHGTFWPNLPESNYTHTGVDTGEGYNVNVPLNATGLGDSDYLAIVNNVLLPVAYEYEPDIILVSAGYDACTGCPEGQMNVTPAFYSHLITSLSGLCEGKIVCILEGGYFQPSLAEAALLTIKALLGDPCNRLELSRHIDPTVIDTINDVKYVLQKNKWRCFNEEHVNIDDPITYDRYNNHMVVSKYLGKQETAPFPTKYGYPLVDNKQKEFMVAKLNYLCQRYFYRKNKVGYINLTNARHCAPPDVRAQETPHRSVEIAHKLEEFHLINKMTRYTEDQDFEVDPYILDIHAHCHYQAVTLNTIVQKQDLYSNKDSHKACLSSIRALLQLSASICNGEIRSGIAVIRPPGHHAKREEGGGFCLLNNVAICGSYLIKERVSRVLIIDFDIHHGDGTQQITYRRDDIMYISIHRFDEGKFFPNDPKGNYNYVGLGKGAGYNVNIPFNKDKMSDSDYMHVWFKLVLPLSYGFVPDVILVSAGFDAGINDPLGHYTVSPETFGHMTQTLKPIAPVILVLEGGYNNETTSLSMAMCAKALIGEPLPMPILTDIRPETKATVKNVLRVQKPFWPFLTLNKSIDPKMRTHKDIEAFYRENRQVVTNFNEPSTSTSCKRRAPPLFPPTPKAPTAGRLKRAVSANVRYEKDDLICIDSSPDM